MSNSSYLMTTPDFSALPSLETLNFEGCDSLVELDISIGSLGKLVFLKLRGCTKLRSLPDTICNLRALEVLNIGECFSVEALPEQLGNIESLKELDAHDVAVSKLPDSTGRLSKLAKLILTCHGKAMIMYLMTRPKHKILETLPDTICNLRELEVLSVGYSRDLEALPVELGNIESLKELNVDDVMVPKIPDSIGFLINLVKLRLTGNQYLETLPKTFGCLRSLEILDISRCSRLIALPVELGNMESLKVLYAQSLPVSELPNSIGHLSKLVELRLSDNTELKTLPDAICNLRSLEILDISYCRSLIALPVELGSMESLKKLYAQGLAVSELPNSIGHLSKLVKLRLSDNTKLKTLPDTICSLRSLEILDIFYCRSLIALPVELGNMESLKKLYAQGLAVSQLPNSIGNLSKLVELNLSNNKELTTLPDTICNLRSLEILCIDSCSSLTALPAELGNMESLKELYAQGLAVPQLPNSIGNLSKLVELKLSNNKELTTLPDTICNLRSLKILYINSCSSLTALPADLGMIDSLKELHARCISVSKIPDSVGRLTKLVKLILRGNKNLRTLPHAMSNMRSLKTLNIDDCSNLEALPADYHLKLPQRTKESPVFAPRFIESLYPRGI
ncbi:hypothetical protein ACET3Z_030879 [Daucus carota]